MKKIKVLVITPQFSLQGGVSEFNRLLFYHSKNELIPFFLTSVGYSGSNIIKSILSFSDYVKFILFLVAKDIDLVHVNPSLGKNALLRDSLFVWLSKLFQKKTFVHWHGWNPENEYLLDRYNGFLKKTLFKADHIKFLASAFRTKFIDKGFTNKTSLGITFIDDDLLNINRKEKAIKNEIKILFLATISKNKGIYIALDVFKDLIIKYPNIKLIIAGVGSELESVKKYVIREEIPNVVFKGYVIGIDKSRTFNEADIYIFPSYYEGMPISLIEALSFGIPIICSSVGAIPDFFQQKKMGFMISNQASLEYSSALELLLIDKELRTRISKFNKKFAVKYFSLSKAIKNIDSDYLELIDNLNEL